jgi:hypothetical protein
MIFTGENEALDSGGMTTYPTQDPQIPMIYMSEDLRHVYVVNFNRWTGTRIRQADAAEIEALARRFDIPDLLLALPATAQSAAAEF